MKPLGRIIKVTLAITSFCLLILDADTAVLGHAGLLMKMPPRDLNPFYAWIARATEEQHPDNQGARREKKEEFFAMELKPFHAWIASMGFSEDQLETKEGSNKPIRQSFDFSKLISYFFRSGR